LDAADGRLSFLLCLPAGLLGAFERADLGMVRFVVSQRKTASNFNKAFASSEDYRAVGFKEGLRLSRRQKKSLIRASKTVVVSKFLEANR
jgi:hypothetical protein